VDKKQSILSYADGTLEYIEKTEQFTYKGVLVGGGLIKRLLYLRDHGYDMENLLKFMDNLIQNPSKDSIMELYDYLEENKVPITEDGCFLSYKRVRDDYFDFYSGSLDYSVGNIVSMPRDKVNPDRNVTCSVGLHAASYNYAQIYGGGGGRMIVLKINPHDVVSVPKEYRQEKMRVCRLEVIADITDTRQKTKSYFVDTSTDFLVDEDFDEEWDEDGDLEYDDYDVDEAIEKEDNRGARVEWESQANGIYTTKYGNFVAVIEPGESLLVAIDDFLLEQPEEEDISMRGVKQDISSVKRCLVIVDKIVDDYGNMRPMKKRVFYAPRYSKLSGGFNFTP